MKGDFEEAVNNNEITAYFNGEGDYFSPEEGCMGYHSYIMNFTGMISYLKNKEHPYQLMVKYFRLYLSSLKEDALDAWSLFRNINCFYFFQKNNRYFLTQNEDLIDELTAEEKKKIGILCRYLRENFDKVPGAAQMYPIDKQFEFTRKNGCRYVILAKKVDKSRLYDINKNHRRQISWSKNLISNSNNNQWIMRYLMHTFLSANLPII